MTRRTWLLAALGALLAAGPAHAQGTTFTYQGRLASGAAPADGSHDFEFRLYDAAAGGSQQGSTQSVAGVAVSGGLFTVALDFGGAFDGSPRFLAGLVDAGCE